MARLETFPNRHPGRDYTRRAHLPRVHLGVPEDGTARLRHHPDHLRPGPALRGAQEPEALPPGLPDQGIFYEDVVNVILDDLVAATKPRRLTVEGDFRVRGGISSRGHRHLRGPAHGAAGGSDEGPHVPRAALRGRGAAAGRGARRASGSRRKGIKATFDKLGEDVLDREAAKRATERGQGAPASHPRRDRAQHLDQDVVDGAGDLPRPLPRERRRRSSTWRGRSGASCASTWRARSSPRTRSRSSTRCASATTTSGSCSRPTCTGPRTT